MKKITTLFAFLMLIVFGATAQVTPLTIAQARTTVNGDSVLQYANQIISVSGTVYGPNSNKYPSTGLTFWIFNDTADAGIKIYSTHLYGYSVNDGDRVTIQGLLSSYHGSPEIDLADSAANDTIILDATGTPDTAIVINLASLDTNNYGELVQINNVDMSSAIKWGPASGKSYFTAQAPVAGGTLYIYVYEYTDTALFNHAQPMGTYNVRGIGDYSIFYGQPSYNIDPRHFSDFILVDTTVNSINTIADRLTAVVYPNPASTQVTVGFNSDNNQTVTSKMFDVTGREVLSVTNDATEGNNELHLNTADLSNGLYVLDVRLGAKSMITKINIVK